MVKTLTTRTPFVDGLRSMLGQFATDLGQGELCSKNK